MKRCRDDVIHEPKNDGPGELYTEYETKGRTLWLGATSFIPGLKKELTLTLQLISNVIICTKTNEEIKQTFEKVTNCKKEAQSLGHDK